MEGYNLHDKTAKASHRFQKNALSMWNKDFILVEKTTYKLIIRILLGIINYNISRILKP